MLDVRRRLSAPDLPDRLHRLGFRVEDTEDALIAADRVLADGVTGRVQVLAERLLPGIGVLADDGGLDPWDCPEARDQTYGTGVLPMLALVTTAPEVQDYHRGRGVDDEASWRALSDLGQQVWVHRRTFGEFGLHTHGWLRVGWSGGFFWLGRLQFNLTCEQGEWLLSTHIPQTGPLHPELVDEAMRRAEAFFAEHFSDYPIQFSGPSTGSRQGAQIFHCGSWLLDPELAAALPAESNMARFQRRWQLYGEPLPGDEDAIFFVFARRGPVDLDTLPQQTTLQRVIIDRLRAGGHWQVWNGRAPAPTRPPYEGTTP